MMSEEEMKSNTEAFNKLFDLRSEVRQGTLKILYTAWDSVGTPTSRGNMGHFLVSEVPLPAAGWLFLAAIGGLIGKQRFKK